MQGTWRLHPQRYGLGVLLRDSASLCREELPIEPATIRLPYGLLRLLCVNVYVHSNGPSFTEPQRDSVRYSFPYTLSYKKEKYTNYNSVYASLVVAGLYKANIPLVV